MPYKVTRRASKYGKAQVIGEFATKAQADSVATQARSILSSKYGRGKIKVVVTKFGASPRKNKKRSARHL